MQHFPISESPKPALRKQAIALRATLPMPEISRAIRAQLVTLPEFRNATRVLFYHPFRDEVDFLPLAEAFPGKAWFLPTVEPGHSITFHPYQPEHPLSTGAYGIQEPEKWGDNALTPERLRPDDFMLLPGLLFDLSGYRLGYGKGYFDRFLGAAERMGKSCVTVGGVPEGLLRDALPVDPWDLPVQWIVTEKKILKTQPRSGASS